MSTCYIQNPFLHKSRKEPQILTTLNKSLFLSEFFFIIPFFDKLKFRYYSYYRKKIIIFQYSFYEIVSN